MISKSVVALVTALLLSIAGCQKAPEPPKAAAPASAAAEDAAKARASADAAALEARVKEAKEVAQQAYVYGYSLITTEVTRMQMSNVPKAEGLRAPTGQFLNVPRYPPADYRGVSAPNADTLYSLAWVDLSEPQVLSHPDMGKRFFLFEMVDLWMTIVKTPGSRTDGGKAANYLLSGPGWQGEVPAGMTHIAFPARYVVILGRTYADGQLQDYKTVNALQAKYTITPLASFGKPFKYEAPPVVADPGFSMTDKPQEVILAMDTAKYFNLMAQLMCKDAPPATEDAPLLAKMATLGIEPCKSFDMAALDPAVQAALKDLPQTGLKAIEANRNSMGQIVDGWVIAKGLGRYGTDYMKRAVVAAYGWPANLQDDAVYPYTEVDSKGEKLSGANKYTLTFAKGETPPVEGFWSITMYMVDGGWWFVPNPLNKFTVSPRNKLRTNADGSTTLYFQTDSPGKDKESNWLPAPAGEFIPMLRMYGPQQKPPSVLDGTWTPPAIVKAS